MTLNSQAGRVLSPQELHQQTLQNNLLLGQVHCNGSTKTQIEKVFLIYKCIIVLFPFPTYDDISLFMRFAKVFFSSFRDLSATESVSTAFCDLDPNL